MLIVMRLRKVKGASETIAAHPEIVIPNGEELKGNWQSVFEKEQPIYIEVGMGKGQFMIGMAKQNPHLNFIGIEKFDSVMVRALEKVLEAGELPNLKLLKIDAEDLTDIFAENEVEGVYLNFSDPWPKPRHAKRRLTHENFLTRYEQITVPNGYLRFKTDNRLLFEYSLVSVTGYGMKLEDVALDLHQREALDWNIMTEYEVEGVDVLSQVSDQPFSDAETVLGASHRAQGALAFGDIGIGLEAGVEYLNDQLFLVNWGVLKTKEGQTFYAGGTRLSYRPLVMGTIRP